MNQGYVFWCSRCRVSHGGECPDLDPMCLVCVAGRCPGPAGPHYPLVGTVWKCRIHGKTFASGQTLTSNWTYEVLLANGGMVKLQARDDTGRLGDIRYIGVEAWSDEGWLLDTGDRIWIIPP